MERQRDREDLAAYYGELLEEQVASGLNVVDFAAEVGVSWATLYSWRRRLGVEGARPKLVEVQVPAAAHGLAASGSMRLRVGDRFQLELEPGFDGGELERLLGVLARC